MPSTEDRVVRMVFDNATFEKKIADTLASLGKLDNALKFQGATKGLTDINTAAGKLDFRTISAGIENVSKGFIALSTIAITALSRISSAAFAAGANLVKAFTLSPIIEGFREYETQLNSVQTILANTASKGTTLDQVNDALQRLNEYSDQTIYNFGQMARNIGTFTAAGVDLETSVSSIKGIANIAAMSGSSAEQASTAMYQLSQAIAQGSVKLMDWNSVVNAGMGGEAFKSALFETQKAMGNVLGVPVDMTFKQWEDAGNSFRETLQDGWITADVLTTTLSAFTGDMTEEMLLQKGFNEQQAAAILKTAAIAKAAATEVKTFTQLVGTVKEAVGTGWADSFKIIIGNFNEAKTLWTNVNNSIGAFVNQTSDARNALLQGWKDMGGRTLLIESLSTAFRNFGLILEPIKEAFRNVFPPTTAQNLYDITTAFSRFATALAPTQETVEKLRSVFQGFFSLLSIGWTILKEGIGFIVDIGRAIADAFGGEATDALAEVGDGLSSLQDYLVDGGKIAEFFDKLTEAIKGPIQFLKKLATAIGDFFSKFDLSSGQDIIDTTEEIGDSFSGLGAIFERLTSFFEPLRAGFERIVPVINAIIEKVVGFFKDLGQRIADALNQEDFNAVFDALNTALLGGIALLIAKFLKGGISLDLGGGMFEKIGKSFDQLTSTLSAMQTNIKANALLKIAGAIAILTASVVVLASIDSAALSKALTAMAVGFGQLLAAFSAFTKIITDPKTAASFTITAAGMVVLGSAMLILSFAVRSLAKLDWEELGRGLSATLVLIGALAIASKPLSANSKGMIAAGIGMMAMAAALLILSIPVKVFSKMSWEELGKGMAGVAAALAIIAAAMYAMPSGLAMIAQGAGLLAVAVSLNIIAGAVAIFGTMDWETIGKGMVGIAGSLGLIAGALNLMPVSTPIIAAGLVLVGIALTEIAGASKLFATMSWDEIARGMTSMAGALLILSGALFLMGQSGMGAAALVVAAVGLGMLGAVVKQFSKLGWDTIAQGLGAMAASLAAVALASLAIQPAIGAMIALGVALTIIGAAFALAGVGVWALAKGLSAIVKLGEGVGTSLATVLETFSKALPTIMRAAAEGVVEALNVFIKAAPAMAKTIGVLIDVILDVVIRELPKLYVIMDDVLTKLNLLIREHAPALIKTGIFLIISLLKGIREKIDNVVQIVADIVVKFLDALQAEIPRLTQEVATTIITWWTNVGYQLGRVAGTILFGVGKAFLQGLWDGALSQLGPIGEFFMNIASNVVGWVGDTISTLWQKGRDFIQGIINGYLSIYGEVTSFFANIAGEVLSAIGNLGWTLVQKGRDLIQGLWNGILSLWQTITNFFTNLPSNISGNISNPLDILWNIGLKIMQGLWNGLKEKWEEVKDWLSNLNPANWFNDINLPKGHAAKNMLPTGLAVMGGLHYGMQEGWNDVTSWLETLDPSDSMSSGIADSMTKAVASIADKMSDISEFAPTITPVLDLSRVQRDAALIGAYIGANTVSPSLSYGHARIISRTSQANATAAESETPGRNDITFTQINNSPTQLSTSDIYKNTRNQIRIAKEELSIP